MSDDGFVRDLLDDAVSDVEPTDRLGAIRARTARDARRSRRSWYAVSGAALAAAAVVVTVAVVTTGDDVPVRPEVAADPPTSAPSTGPSTATTPVYYLGPGPDGPDAPEAALYRYFEPAGDPLELLMSTPSDPDYMTAWPEGSLLAYEVAPTEIVVTVADEITGAEALAWQQVVYTLQATTGSRLPVRFENPEADLGDVPGTPAPDVLSHVSISDPGEGFVYTGTITARGVGRGFEGTVACSLLDEDGTELRSVPTIAGSGDELEPWELEVDLSGVPAGTYDFVCRTDDPTGGTDGVGAYSDSRTVVVEEQTVAPYRGTTVYYVGPGPDGPDARAAALYPVELLGYGTPLAHLMSTPDDPDLRTLWPAGSLTSYDVLPDRIEVRVTGGPVDDPLARQQLAHTLTSSLGTDLPVVLEWADGREEPIRPFATAPLFSVVSHLVLAEPSEGATHSGSLTARGLSNGFEASVACRLRSTGGAGEHGPFVGQAEGWLEERLYPWELEIDLRGVAPGEYELACSTDDPTGGTEGAGAWTDTRTITVE